MLPYPPKGGSVQRSFNLIKELSKRYQVALFAFDERRGTARPPGEDDSLTALKAVCEHVTLVPLPSGDSKLAKLFTLGFNLLKPTPYSVDLLVSEEMSQALASYTRTHLVDLVHADAIEMTPYAEQVPAKVKILNHHNAESLLLNRRAKSLTNPLARWYVQHQSHKLHRYEAEKMPGFDTNLSVSDEDKEVLQRIASDAHVGVVPNGVDTEYFHPSSDEPVPGRVIYMGGLTWYPNYDAVQHLIADIWPHIRKGLPEATCQVIGRIPAGRKLGNLPDGMETTGFVDDVRPYLAQAQALIVPLRVGGGTRLKILDGMASGKAVISSSIGCEGLGLTPEEEILIGDQPEEFARQVIRLCNDSALRKKIEQAGRDRAEHQYAWPIIGESLYQQLERIASSDEQ